MSEGNSSRNRGTLYIVATPIGNLEDLTFRALKTLDKAAAIACEDTRQTRKLLARYDLHKKLISYFKPREQEKIPLIISMLEQGQDIALVSDAGTPGISDPGFPLIKQAVAQGIKVCPIPGPCAVSAALSAAGLPTHKFLFLGFPPVKKQQTINLLQSYREESATLIFYLPARNMTKFLELLQDNLPEREIVIARELTKIYEEFIRGTPEELTRKLQGKTLKGEITLLIHGKYRKTRP